MRSTPLVMTNDFKKIILMHMMQKNKPAFFAFLPYTIKKPDYFMDIFIATKDAKDILPVKQVSKIRNLITMSLKIKTFQGPILPFIFSARGRRTQI